MNIIKRNGSEVAFDKQKIFDAIKGANKDAPHHERLSDEAIMTVTDRVTTQCHNLGHTPSVEEIQTLVENALMDSGSHSVAREYITYRYEHDAGRDTTELEQRVLALVNGTNEDDKQENSNKNPDILSVQRDYLAGEVSKAITWKRLVPPDIVKAHNEGIIHFHDGDYFIQHSHNCFHGNTKFVTDKGIKAFNEFHDGDTVIVKDKDGNMREATVRRYKPQPMRRITLKAGRRSTTVRCTPDHRWILADGSVTTNLKIGDYLYKLQDSTEYNIDNFEDAEAFCVGFIVGDGCDTKYDTVQARLCGNKKQYANIFLQAGYKLSEIKDSDDLVATRKGAFKQDFLNARAWRFMTAEHKALAFHGLYAADGSTSDIGTHRISTTDERVEKFIQDTSALAGYYVSNKRETYYDTNYKTNARIVNYHLIVSQPENLKWKVVNIDENLRNGHTYDTWCVEEPITNSFTLAEGIVTGNCCLINLADMLQNGTVISGTMIEKPHSFATACNIATQIIAQVASNQYGGQTVTLSHLAPFVDISRQKIRENVIEEMTNAGIEITTEQCESIVDDRLKKEIKAGIQTIQYQVETIMTTNGQAPFITVFMYLDEVPEGQIRDDLAMIIEETIRQRYRGVKNEAGVWATPAFPKLVYVLDEDNIYPDSKYYYITQLAAKCTAKRMVPDYVSAKIMRQLKLSADEEPGQGDVYGPMGCRSFLTPDRSGNGFDNIANAGNWEPDTPKYYGRFNQGVVTLNLPDIALSSGGDFDKFWEIFDERLNMCHRALRVRHERLLNTPSDVAPILWQHGALARLAKGETINELLYHGYSTLSLGYAGLYECVKYMMGASHTDEIAKPFALEVMKHMNNACTKWKAEEDIDYSVYGTPIESTTYKFAKCLQRRFGVIKDITDHGYITNSYHVNVREEIDAYSKLAFEAEFQPLSPGGAISYIEVPDMQNNLQAVIDVMTFIYDHIMYAELNTKSDYCQVCGYDGEIQIYSDKHGKLGWKCPNCGNTDQNKMSVARRTCGYIGTQFWNQGRTQEIKDRVLHL